MQPAPDPAPDLDRRAFLAAALPKAATAVAACALGFLIDDGWARAVRGLRLQRADYPRMVVGGWRVHHNVVGWALLVVGLFALPWVLIPLGLGMIVGHRRRDRLFWFLERVE
jgi:hypothetical protein